MNDLLHHLALATQTLENKREEYPILTRMKERIARAEDCLKIMKLNIEAIENLHEAKQEFCPLGPANIIESNNLDIFADGPVMNLVEKKLRGKIVHYYAELQLEL